MMAIETNTKNTLIHSDIFRLLSKGFSYPNKESLDVFKDIAETLSVSNKIKPKHQQLISQLLSELDEAILLNEYSRLFLKGTVPITESFCCSKLDSGPDVAAFYNAFGMKAKQGEAPDAMTYQLEFAAILLVKEFLAETDEQYEVTRDAFKKFINDHLYEFSGKFKEKVLNAAPYNFYITLSDLLVDFIEDVHKNINE